ncbi:hypothetical protein [Bradyrhizobium sp.]|uniref:hypothetical protein n=1 Tax=Bradyrhizobium sp. TaxID=376 RepID=UPI000AC7CF36|nr:hypothetical protein [Bradyrhizobium sp.]
MTGAERTRKFSEKRYVAAAPINAQFDRELRLVIIHHVSNDSVTPAKALGRAGCATSATPAHPKSMFRRPASFRAATHFSDHSVRP